MMLILRIKEHVKKLSKKDVKDFIFYNYGYLSTRYYKLFKSF